MQGRLDWLSAEKAVTISGYCSVKQVKKVSLSNRNVFRGEKFTVEIQREHWKRTGRWVDMMSAKQLLLKKQKPNRGITEIGWSKENMSGQILEGFNETEIQEQNMQTVAEELNSLITLNNNLMEDTGFSLLLCAGRLIRWWLACVPNALSDNRSAPNNHDLLWPDR